MRRHGYYRYYFSMHIPDRCHACVGLFQQSAPQSLLLYVDMHVHTQVQTAVEQQLKDALSAADKPWGLYTSDQQSKKEERCLKLVIYTTTPLAPQNNVIIAIDLYKCLSKIITRVTFFLDERCKY